MSASAPKYTRILLKLSGEAFSAEGEKGFAAEQLQKIITEIAAVHHQGVEIAIVVGAGNLWRFRDFEALDIPRVASDQIGMIATAMNTLALSNLLNNAGVSTQPYCAFAIESIIPRYQIFTARKALQEKKVIVLGGGTSHPFFTTDTSAALRALELECNVLLKATKVDGVYDADPTQNSQAQKYTTLSFAEAMEKNLRVMDQAAFSLCSENSLPLIVYDGFSAGNLQKVVAGKSIGTTVS